MRSKRTFPRKRKLSVGDNSRSSHRIYRAYRCLPRSSSSLCVQLGAIEAMRYQVAFDSGLLSFQHAAAALVLARQRIYPAAYALMRLQYECSLRGFWLTYAASRWIEKLGLPLTNESAQQANKLAMPAEMLDDLAKCHDAPKLSSGSTKRTARSHGMPRAVTRMVACTRWQEW
jgi:hypothetical protein